MKQTTQVVPPSDLMKYKYQQLHWFGSHIEAWVTWFLLRIFTIINIWKGMYIDHI